MRRAHERVGILAGLHTQEFLHWEGYSVFNPLFGTGMWISSRCRSRDVCNQELVPATSKWPRSWPGQNVGDPRALYFPSISVPGSAPRLGSDPAPLPPGAAAAVTPRGSPQPPGGAWRKRSAPGARGVSPGLRGRQRGCRGSLRQPAGLPLQSRRLHIKWWGLRRSRAEDTFCCLPLVSAKVRSPAAGPWDLKHVWKISGGFAVHFWRLYKLGLMQTGQLHCSFKRWSRCRGFYRRPFAPRCCAWNLSRRLAGLGAAGL